MTTAGSLQFGEGLCCLPIKVISGTCALGTSLILGASSCCCCMSSTVCCCNCSPSFSTPAEDGCSQCAVGVNVIAHDYFSKCVVGFGLCARDICFGVPDFFNKWYKDGRVTYNVRPLGEEEEPENCCCHIVRKCIYSYDVCVSDIAGQKKGSRVADYRAPMVETTPLHKRLVISCRQSWISAALNVLTGSRHWSQTLAKGTHKSQGSLDTNRITKTKFSSHQPDDASPPTAAGQPQNHTPISTAATATIVHEQIRET
jgi:hypothetical protein